MEMSPEINMSLLTLTLRDPAKTIFISIFTYRIIDPRHPVRHGKSREGDGSEMAEP
jgi:hypothetical protein